MHRSRIGVPRHPFFESHVVDLEAELAYLSPTAEEDTHQIVSIGTCEVIERELVPFPVRSTNEGPANRGESLTLEKKHDDVRLAISLRPERNRFLGRQVNGHHRSRTRIENGARPSAHRSVFNHAGDGQRPLASFDAALLNLDLGSRFAANEAIGRND